MSLLLVSTARKAVNVQPVTALATGSSSPQTANIVFKTDGSVLYSGGAYNWFSVVTLNVGNDYEIFAEVSGTPPTNPFTGTLNTWLALTDQKVWALSANSGSDIGWLLIKIRKAGESVVMSEAITTFAVEVTNGVN